MALFVLGLSDALTALAVPGRDDTGLLLDADHLPKRVRPPGGALLLLGINLHVK